MDGRLKAVKLIHPRFLNRPRARRRFLEETQNWTLLEHPALVRVEAVGLDWNRGYLALPYLNGGTLRERLHGPLSLELIWHFLEPLASALDYLHECQVLHLNVTPQNILFDEWDQPLLADAGLAPLLNQLAQEGGARLALPLSPYLAPEQHAGQSDQRSDVYALGVLLYQMVVGQPPAEDASTGALIQQMIQETPLLQGHSPSWQTEFAQMVVRSLSQKPEDRYQTASELLEAFYTLAGQMD
jgi:serine/threonine protein kinase